MTFRSLFDKEKNGTNKNSTKIRKVKNIDIYNNRKQNEIQKKFETKQTKTNYKQKKKPNRNTWFCPE